MGTKKIILTATIVATVLLGGYVVVYETFLNDFSGLNHYEVLGVDQKASLADIKRAFRSLSIKYHPDKSGAALHNRRFEKISEAYTVLSSSDSRGVYDVQLAYERQSRAIHTKWMRPQSWSEVLVWPTDWSPKTIIKYLIDLPKSLWPLICESLSLESLLMMLILLATCLFAVDLVARFVWRMVQLVLLAPLRWLWPNSNAYHHRVVSCRFDESLRAARVRQQLALEAGSRRRFAPKGHLLRSHPRTNHHHSQ